MTEQELVRRDMINHIVANIDECFGYWHNDASLFPTDSVYEDFVNCIQNQLPNWDIQTAEWRNLRMIRRRRVEA
jgi:hypothetical protein